MHRLWEEAKLLILMCQSSFDWVTTVFSTMFASTTRETTNCPIRSIDFTTKRSGQRLFCYERDHGFSENSDAASRLIRVVFVVGKSPQCRSHCLGHPVVSPGSPVPRRQQELLNQQVKLFLSWRLLSGPPSCTQGRDHVQVYPKTDGWPDFSKCETSCCKKETRRE